LTSSSQAKLDRAVTLLGPLLRAGGAADALQTIDYSKVEDWDVEAKRLNGGMGVDFVIEIAGRGTIGRSIRSTRQGGLIAVSGKSARNILSILPDDGRIHVDLLSYTGRDFQGRCVPL
jgi:NADPH:quinone reductase-like Zn-dependent oxidoreductase